jgi:hypothetical protein
MAREEENLRFEFGILTEIWFERQIKRGTVATPLDSLKVTKIGQ